MARLNSKYPGLITIVHPTKPIITASHRLNPTFSLRSNGEKTVTINGATKAKVRAFDKDITDIE